MIGQSESVLLIDADPELHVAFAAAIAAEMTFFGAKSVDLGLRIASRRPPAVAVIDVTAPSRKVEEIVAALRAVSPGVRVIFVTQSHDPVECARLMAIGPVLPKPFEVDRLRHLVRNALRLRGMSDNIEVLRSRTGQFHVPAPPSGARRAPPSNPGLSPPPSSSGLPPSSPRRSPSNPGFAPPSGPRRSPSNPGFAPPPAARRAPPSTPGLSPPSSPRDVAVVEAEPPSEPPPSPAPRSRR